MANIVLGTPIYSDEGVVVRPAFDGSGRWRSALPPENLQNPDQRQLARSLTAAPEDTRLGLDLMQDRQVRVAAVTRHNLVQAPVVLVDWRAGEDLPDGYVFARLGTATYHDEDGVVRTAASQELRTAHYYNGRRGMLVEPQRTNLCTRSQELDNASWTKTRATVGANADTAPDGTATADRIIEDATAANTHLVGLGGAAIVADSYVSAAVYLKAGTRTWARLQVANAGDGFSAFFDLSGGSVGATANGGAGVLSHKVIERLANGWYRCLVGGKVNGGITSVAINIYIAEADNDSVFDGDGASYISAWGAQVENAAFPSSYIPTTTTTADRVADSLYLPFTRRPGPMAVEVDQTNVGAFVNDGLTKRFFSIGSATITADPRFVGFGALAGTPSTLYDDGTVGAISTSGPSIPPLGARVRTKHLLSARGTVGLETTYDGTPVSVAGNDIRQSFPAAWAAERLYLAGLSADNGVSILHSLRVATTPSATAKWRVRGVPGGTLFAYVAGDDIAELGGVFSRPSTATYVDRFGYLRTAAAGVPRDDHWMSSERTLLLEAARTNLCLRSERFDTWTLTNATASANVATAPDGTLTAELLTATNTSSQATRNVTFTGDGEKCFSVYLKQGSGTRGWVQVRDATAAVNRHKVRVTWVAGVPSLSTTGGAGTLYPVEALANGWYRILISATGIVAANTNNVGVSPDDLVGTETVYAWGAQAEDAVVPSSYIPTDDATVTRAADSLYFPYTAVPQAMTIYSRGVERSRTPWETSGGGSSQRLVQISGAADTGARILLYKPQSGSNYGVFYSDGATNASSQIGISPLRGDLIEARGVLSSGGVVAVGAVKNAGAESLGTPAAAIALPGVWAGSLLHVGSIGTVGGGMFATTHVVVAAGEQSMDTMRAAVYDSGWLDAWPPGQDAETIAGLEVPLVHVLPTTAPACREWGIQFHDPENADGYVEAGRLVLAGGYQPETNLDYAGSGFGLVSRTTREDSDGEDTIFDVRRTRRQFRFTLSHVGESEAFLSAWGMQKRLGLHNQLFLVTDPEDTDLMHLKAFLGTMRELSALEFAYADRHTVPFVVEEAL